ncbi:MAG: hypothetical protein EYC70_00155 [Planctomycetota bacterium]|nr:MAG: hypothetical protein EYC70_00155 [Planctomycetota bacterium]
MTRWWRWLFDDLGNKGLAVALAAGVWWLMQVKIELRQEHSFLVVATHSGAAPSPQELHNTVRIQVPEGWKLVTPAPGSQLRFVFYGTRAQLNHFFGSYCTAAYRPPQPPEQATSFEDIMEAGELDWMRSREAQQLLDVDDVYQNELRLELVRAVHE